MSNNQLASVYSIVDAKPIAFGSNPSIELADQDKSVIIKNSGNFRSREVDMDTRIDKLEKRVDSMESTLSRLNETMLKLDSKIDLQTSKLESAITLQSSKIESAVALQGVELKSAIENQKVAFDGKLKDVRLSLILWILGLPSLFFVVYRIYEAINIKH
ncbi:hypothetical protein KKJ06_18455 [Xenorhabdus bovienii]|uniref:hypothetical protein n=1 Tax=Xenorhabdus bovienii TaxID=40576 RepID=UPI0023B3289D|nr:hypothetical protein [Xenorhabdus bovienii]MDE9447362.1 hypothetical protein [Xenorhabdus bovienii]MDE9552773.1 hypothetical protein [Xenorhabdus bovienii]MDE9557345.1 hypothetical protein [Xenorhabdus bovienii]